MIDGLPKRFRAELAQILPEGASIRRAKGEWLFVTDALHRTGEDLSPALAAAGFEWQAQRGMLMLRPGAARLTELENACEPTDFLCESLARFRGRTPCGDAIALFAMGVRMLECADPTEICTYDRRVRNLAAVCLRKNLGGAYACALLHPIFERRIST